MLTKIPANIGDTQRLALRGLTDPELLLKTKDAVKEERMLTLQVLRYLQEIERRRLYSVRGYSSLFEFCVKELRYSESSAQRRIASTRLLREIPVAPRQLPG